MGAYSVISWSPFLKILLFLLGYTVLFGRFFCGWACAFGSLGDFIFATGSFIQKKSKKKLPKIPESIRLKADYLKYFILFLIIILCFLGVYTELNHFNPWSVFSMIISGNFSLKSFIPGVLILLLIMTGMVFQERFFCRFLCPMGAVFSLMPMIPLSSLFRSRQNCIKGCSACARVCPADIKLPDDYNAAKDAGCFQCQKCTNICPKQNIHTGIKKIRGCEIFTVLIKAVILFLVCMAAGV